MKYCQNCGSEVTTNDKFCTACGSDLNNNSIVIVSPPKDDSKGCFIRGFAIIGVITVIILVIAFASSLGSSDNSPTETTETTTSVFSINKSYEDSIGFSLHECVLTYNSSKIVTDKYDEEEHKYLIVNYQLTNTSDENIVFDDNLMVKAFQNGISLDEPISTYGIPDFDFHNQEKEVKPNATIKVQQAFRLDSTKNDVTIEIYNNYLSKTPSYQFTIDLTKD